MTIVKEEVIIIIENTVNQIQVLHLQICLRQQVLMELIENDI